MKSIGARTVRLTARGEVVRDVVVGLLLLAAVAWGWPS